MEILLITMLILLSIVLLIREASAGVWCVMLVAMALLVSLQVKPGVLGMVGVWLFPLMFGLAAIPAMRSRTVSRLVLHIFKKRMPGISLTEREALEAGTVWFEGALFSGKPDFQAFLDTPPVSLTGVEQAFIDGPLNTLCSMIDDWQITHELSNLPESMWAFIKEQRFLGMIIPTEYGGLGFSATAQSIILARLYGRSISVATTVSVPNSLGPAELLLKYGTESQKQYYLPRLADGREIPCFALTGPHAGSDAAAIPDTGYVCMQDIDGKAVLGIRLRWDKRYITLAPVATVIGLAFRLYDPDNLLGKGEDIGISCALIPAHTQGITRGRRHFPLNTAFLNGPTQGHDVFVSVDNLIGGVAHAGHGWRMLMECLSAGRAISLPSSANGGAQFLAMATGAYARARYQFGLPIARFEGVEQALARIGAYAYLIKASVRVTAMALDHGEAPAVAGALLKYHTTEYGRRLVMDAMDVHGGKGICLGPKNYIGRGYQNIPIGITVEGANILTRNLIIFGQGVMRCHPYIYAEIQAVQAGDLAHFDTVFWRHIASILSQGLRSLGFAWGLGGRVSGVDALPQLKPYFQAIQRYSVQLSVLTDCALMMLGGALKRHEMLSARFGDILSYIYLTSCVLKNFHDDGAPETDLVLVHWVCQHLLYQADDAMHGILHNFPGRLQRIFLRFLVNPFLRKRMPPSDALGAELARLLYTQNPARDRLIQEVYRTDLPNCPGGTLETLFEALCHSEPLEKRVQDALKEGRITGLTREGVIYNALSHNIVTQEQADILLHVEHLRQSIIAVDDFAHEDLARDGLRAHGKKKCVPARSEYDA